MMKMYTTYINEYDGATAVWTKFSVKPEFADYITVYKQRCFVCMLCKWPSSLFATW
jgi:hypothetical protein